MTLSLLLDTHAFVWALNYPHRLGAGARQVIEDPSTPVFVSAASVWEMAIKHRAGKWPEAEPALSTLSGALTSITAWLWPVNGTHAVRAGTLDWSHKDPFDRMLAAVALTDKLTLVSEDREFGDVPELSVLW